jgi:guanyl-specific ribonuclease Sa
MARLLSLFMMLALVMTQGTSMASALCRHQSAQEHILARQSHDAKIAAVAIGEEEAAATASKKASQSVDSSSHWPAEILPAEAETPPLRIAEPLRLRPELHAALASATILPLLKPPSA